MKAQELGGNKSFPGDTFIDERALALETARNWRYRNTIWIMAEWEQHAPSAALGDG